MAKNFTRRFTLTGNKQTGEAVESSNNGNLLATTSRGDKVWFPAGAQIDKAISYTLHEKGDTFIATADSKTTKLEGWLRANPTAKEEYDKAGNDAAKIAKALKDCNVPTAKQLEPLFFVGETVTRQAESIEWVGFSSEELKSEEEELSLFAKKAKILADLGVKLSM